MSAERVGQPTKFVVPPDEIMRAMAKIAIEVATSDLAKIAEEMAATLRGGGAPYVTAPDALDAFAATIRQCNHDMYGPKNPVS